jgi:putative membrane protein
MGMSKSRMILAPMALALLITGCNQKATDTTDSVKADASDLVSDAATSISDAAADVQDAVTATPTGAKFANKAAKSDAFEIAAAKLAKAQSSRPDIKQFAAMMITDHTGSTAKIKKAAAAADPAITPDATLTDDQNGKLADLGKLSGADFDGAYVSQQIAAHKEALALMTVYADKGDVPSLKAAAAEIKPKVQMHLDTIKAIKAKLP